MSLVTLPFAQSGTADALSDSLFVLGRLREISLQIDEELRRNGLEPPPDGVPITVPSELLDTVILKLEVAKEQDRASVMRLPLIAGLVGAAVSAFVIGIAWFLSVMG